MSRKLAFIGVNIIACTLWAGCSSSKPTLNETHTKVEVLGDPRELYAGADTKPDFDLDFFDSQAVTVIGTHSFVEKSIRREEDAATIKAQNAPAKEDQIERRAARPQLNVTVLKDSGVVQLKATDDTYSIQLSKRPGGNPAVTIAGGKVSFVSELIHFSVGSDGKAFNILLFNDDPRAGKSLMVIALSKAAPAVSAPKTEARFNYLLGPGVKAGWTKGQPVKINACGGASRYSMQIDAAVAKWKKELGDNLEVVVEVADKFYPFSDLTQNCIYFVSNYLAVAAKTHAQFGVTISSISPSTFEFLDSDILVFENEILKPARIMGADVVNRVLNFTLVHELGHFFGLHHQFDGTPSVMNYPSVPEISDDTLLRKYDQDAIKALYR